MDNPTLDRELRDPVYEVSGIEEHPMSLIDVSDAALAETAAMMARIEAGDYEGVDPEILELYDLLQMPSGPISDEAKDGLPPEAFG